MQAGKGGYFWVDVMKQCTPIGSRELPGLPEKELKMLKKAQYWRNKVEFEPVWRQFNSVANVCV